MKIKILGADSRGARSVATFVETKDLKIFIDPGVSLGPRRYGLPPHPLEYNAYNEQWDAIKKHAKQADIIIISHYHYDHYNPFEDLELYKNKLLLVKHPTDKINASQKTRAKKFLRVIEGVPEKIEYAEDFEYKKGATKLLLSPAFPHGHTEKLGFVTITKITEGKMTFMHSSDVEGPTLKSTTDWIIENNPNILWLDGLPTIFLGWMHPIKNLKLSNDNEVRILREANKLKTLILEHHILRDLKYKEKIKPVLEAADELKKQVLTSAEFMGKDNEFLEALRKRNWKENPPPKSFKPLKKKIFGD